MRFPNKAYSCDGKGYAENQLSCVHFAKDNGLRNSQYVVVQRGHHNYDQTAELWVTAAAWRKIQRKERQTLAWEQGDPDWRETK